MSSSAKSSDSRTPSIHPSRSGSRYARVGSILIHSAYDPEREAVRFVDSELGNEAPAVVLVLGEGLGFLSRAIVRKHPFARVLPVFYHETFAAQSDAGCSWSPASQEPIGSFLEHALSELDVEGIRVVEWPPSAKAFPEVSRSVLHAVRQCIRELNGSLVTTAAFGSRWLRNAIVNSLCIDQPVEIASGAGCPAAIIAASGPSLAESLPELQAVRDRVLLIALPSSIRALVAARLLPDLVVATDGSYWASLHLRELGDAAALPVAMPLSAARGIWRTGSPVVILSQGSFFETELLGALGARAVEVQSHGTVAMTALELAERFTEGPIIFAGLDLTSRDIHEHVRPHTFDPLWARSSTRLSPEYGTLAGRALEASAHSGRDAADRGPRALATYAGWMARRLHDGERLFRLNPSAVEMPALRALSGAELRRLLPSTLPDRPSRPALLSTAPATLPPGALRRTRVRSVLASWANELDAVQREIEGWTPEREMPQPGGRAAELLYLLDTRGCVECRRRGRVGGKERANEALLESILRVRAALSACCGRYLP